MIFAFVPPRVRSAVRRLTVVCATAFVAAWTSACDDPFAPRASSAVRTDSFVVYSMTQTPVNAPAAFNIVFFTTLRLEPTYGFDLVFDIDDQGRAVVIPSRLAGGVLTSQRVVGLQKITGDYAGMTRAPANGYAYESPVALSPTEGVVVELKASQCDFQASRMVYAKLQIQAVDLASRRIAFRVTYDPNCGFRSFLPGIPAN